MLTTGRKCDTFTHMSETTKDIKSIVVNEKDYEERAAILDALKIFAADVGKEVFLIGSGDEANLFASAIVGVDESSHSIIYDYRKLVSALMEWNDWDEESAIEWVEYNTIRSLGYVSSNGISPIVMEPIEMFL